MAKNQPTGTYDPTTGTFVPAKKKGRGCLWILLVPVILIFVIVAAFGNSEPSSDDAPATDADETAAAPETEAPETAAPETEAPAPETEAESEPEEDKTSSGGLLSALFGGGKEKEPEVIPERGTPEWNEWWIEKYHINIMTSTKAALGNYYEYKEIKTPLDRSEWTISVFDSDDNFYASTKFTFQGRKYDVIFIGHLTINDKNRVESWEGHYLYAEGKVLFDDGYTKEFWENIAEAAAEMNP